MTQVHSSGERSYQGHIINISSRDISLTLIFHLLRVQVFSSSHQLRVKRKFHHRHSLILNTGTLWALTQVHLDRGNLWGSETGWVTPNQIQGKQLIKTIRSVATTCRRCRPKLVSTSGCVSLLATEQDTPGVCESPNARNLLILASIPSGSLSLPLQSSAESRLSRFWHRHNQAFGIAGFG